VPLGATGSERFFGERQPDFAAGRKAQVAAAGGNCQSGLGAKWVIQQGTFWILRLTAWSTLEVDFEEMFWPGGGQAVAALGVQQPGGGEVPGRFTNA
jgi:hypothetical protein